MKFLLLLLLAMPVSALPIGVSPSLLQLEEDYSGVLTLSNPSQQSIAYEIKGVAKGVIPPETALNQPITLKEYQSHFLIEFHNAPALMVSVLPPKSNPVKGIAIFLGVLIAGCMLGLVTFYFYNKYSRTF